MARLIVELSIRTPAFISKLLDDDMPERNAGDDPLPFLDDDDDDAGEPLRSLGAAVPRISAMTLHQIQLCGTAAGPPQLVARAGPTFEIVLG
jgi:hypothetical protein